MQQLLKYQQSSLLPYRNIINPIPEIIISALIFKTIKMSARKLENDDTSCNRKIKTQNHEQKISQAKT